MHSKSESDMCWYLTGTQMGLVGWCDAAGPGLGNL